LEFVILINNDRFGKKKLPDKFVKFLVGREPAEVTLREVNCGFCWWPVEFLFGEEGNMYLHTGYSF
jgi:hypothetical protein